MTAPTPKQRLAIVAIVLAALVIILSAAETRQAASPPEVVQPAPRQQTHTPAARTEAEPDVAIPLKQIERTSTPRKSGEAFQPKSWYVAPPPPPPPPPAPPTAPPLPFSFLGKAESPEGTPTIFLSGHDRVFLVKGGETIDGMYRIDGIQNGQIVFTYLPMQIQQYLNMGDAP